MQLLPTRVKRVKTVHITLYGSTLLHITLYESTTNDILLDTRVTYKNPLIHETDRLGNCPIDAFVYEVN